MTDCCRAESAVRASQVLTLTCQDRPGLVHATSGALFDIGGNIVENHQFADPDSNIFCMRTVTEVDCSSEAVRQVVKRSLGRDRAQVAVRPASHRPRVLIMVSKFDHCLVDVLYRWSTGALPIEVAFVVSNHPNCAPHAASYAVPFVHLPVTTDTKRRQEHKLRDLVEMHRIELVVLARYMQVLSDEMCDFLDGRAINIHHSFLPGFKGARPYHQAHERGVKLVGATAHFVTANLDEGPIIEQDVARVDHTHTAEGLIALGQDTERIVLSRAVCHWAEDRVFRVGSRTVVLG